MIVVKVLGLAEIMAGRTRIVSTSPKKFALLFHLAVERGRPLARNTLHAMFFPDQSERNAQHSLRELLYQLRRAGVEFHSDNLGVQLTTDSASIETDGILGGKNSPTDGQLRQIAQGLLTGYSPNLSEDFLQWLDAFKARTTWELSRVLVSEIERSRTVTDWPRTELAARACLALDAFNEPATLAMAEVLALGGAKTRAVELLDSYNSEVADRSQELTLAPSLLRRRIGERSKLYGQSEASNTPFVGRERETRFLHDELRKATQGTPRIVVVTGEAGIGKTRLVAEFFQLLRLDGVSVAHAVAQPHDVQRPFAAFADLLDGLLGMRGALGTSPESLKLLKRLTRTPSSDPAELSHFLTEGESSSEIITRAIVDLVDAITSEGLLVLSVDDLQFLDSMSSRGLTRLVARERGRRLLIVCTSRDEGVSVLPSDSRVSTLELHGIDRLASTRIVESFVEREGIEVDPELSGWVQDAAGGHPLFLENLLAHYSRTRERFSIPASLSVLITQRIAALSERGDVALQVCSLLGRFATLDTIADTISLSRFDLIQAVRELELARLIRFDGQTVRPTHSLIADVVLERMTPLQRRLTHRYVATALDKLIDIDYSPAVVWECAEHWSAAGHAGRALAAIRRCASHAIEMGRAETAAQLLARALTLSGSQDERVEIARLLVAAADSAMNSDLVLCAIEVLDGTQRPVKHDDLEFVEFRARTRVYRDNGPQETALFKCVRDAEASADHRVTAASLLLKYADSCLRPESAGEIVSALPSSTIQAANELVRLEFCMIAQTTQRDFDRAVFFARSLLEATEETGTNLRLHYTLNAVLALYRAGHLDEAIGIAERRFAEAGESDAPHLRLTFATLIAEHFADVFEDERSASWWKAIDDIVAAFPSLRSQFPHRIARLSKALDHDDLSTAKELVHEMTRDHLLAGGIIRERWRKVATIRIAQMERNSHMRDEELAQLMLGAQKGSIVGGVCDAEAAAACHQLLLANKISQARAFYESFVTEFRWTHAPIGRCVSQVGRLIDEAEARLRSPAESLRLGANRAGRSGRDEHDGSGSDGSLVGRRREQGVP